MRRRALVTGATSGIGRCVALSLANDGWEVVVHGRQPEKADRVREELEKAGEGRVVPVYADLRQLEEVHAMCARLLEDARPLDLLVNNAGTFFSDRAGLDDTATDPSSLVNVVAPVMLSRALLPLLTITKQSTIINVVSHGQATLPKRDPFRYHPNPAVAYGRSKLAAIIATRGLAREFASFGVNVIAAIPGRMIDTEMSRELLRRLNPLGRLFLSLTSLCRPPPDEAASFIIDLARGEDAAARSGLVVSPTGPLRLHRQACKQDSINAVMAEIDRRTLPHLTRLAESRPSKFSSSLCKEGLNHAC